MNKIKLLSEDTITKIAAGEIIENPASIIKELVENSIDANATSITIEIKNNGKDLIKVTDNGDGFDKRDLSLAFKRHTTSKISSIEELDEALSLGFRGEALSSISSVSDVKIITKNEDDLIGIISDVDKSGNLLNKDEIVTNRGTTIFAKNLFKEIPVREKYLDSKNYEISKTIDIINRLALSHLDISMEFIKDGKTYLKTDNKNSLLNNIYSVLGKDVSENLIPIEGKYNTFNIKGFISNNLLYRSNRNSQYLFVNNRSIIDRDISKAIEKSYYSVIPLNRYPVFILYLEIDGKYLDINIHPKKDIIKFTNIDEIKSQLRNLVDIELKKNLNIFSVKSNKKQNNENTIFDIKEDSNKENIDFHNLSDENFEKSENIYRDKKRQLINFHDLTNDYVSFNEDIENYSDIEEKEINESLDSEKLDNVDTESFLDEEKDYKILKNGYRYIGNLFLQYLLLEDNVDKALFIIDQHAAHERINYEKLVYDYNNSKIPTQNLLQGYIFELTTAEFDELMMIQENLKDIGIEVEEFGDSSIIIRTIPAYFTDINPERLIREILESEDIKTSIGDIDPYKLMQKACKSSVKSGDYINHNEVHNLINQLRECDMPYTCPHGRPTIIKITKNELDKEFFRIQQ